MFVILAIPISISIKEAQNGDPYWTLTPSRANVGVSG
jgi:hypothetical protein